MVYALGGIGAPAVRGRIGGWTGPEARISDYAPIRATKPVARMSASDMRGPQSEARMSLRSSGIRVLRCGGYHFAMVRYRRNRVDGGTYFFTVTLADRPLYHPGRSCELTAHSVSRSTPRAAVCARRDRDPSRSPACNPDLTGRGCEFRRAQVSHQRTLQHWLARCGDTYQPARERRACTLAKAVLGAHCP
jgi:hypothetical protein